jgi:hypothetical protein
MMNEPQVGLKNKCEEILMNWKSLLVIATLSLSAGLTACNKEAATPDATKPADSAAPAGGEAKPGDAPKTDAKPGDAPKGDAMGKPGDKGDAPKGDAMGKPGDKGDAKPVDGAKGDKKPDAPKKP